MKLCTVESPLGIATKCSFKGVECAHHVCQRAQIREPSWKVLLLEGKKKKYSKQLGVCCLMGTG